MTSGVTRALVVSDLHAFFGAEDDGSPSIMQFSGTGGKGAKLLADCGVAVAAQFNKVDFIFVAGDITNHADPGSLEQAWLHLGTLSLQLGAKLVATAGNHDYDSRGNSGHDPKGALIGLDPAFPAGTEESRQHYFAYDYAILEQNDSIVITLNSAAQHGYAFGERNEYEHGRVLIRTIERIERDLANRTLPAVRVLLVHHHVAQLPDLDTSEQSILADADPLLRMLSFYGDWLVVHGHKHRAWMQYSAGGGDSPAVFSAGSFAANFGIGNFAASVQKQFHVLDIFNSSLPATSSSSAGIGQAGTVRTWTYNGFSWVEAGTSDGFPGVSGFGWRTSTSALAARLHAAVLAERRLDRDALLQLEPNFPFLTPDDEGRVIKQLLAKNPSVFASRDSRGTVTELYLKEVVASGS